MKVKQLKEILNQYDDELDVCIGLDVDCDISAEVIPEGTSLHNEKLEKPILSLW